MCQCIVKTPFGNKSRSRGIRNNELMVEKGRSYHVSLVLAGVLLVKEGFGYWMKALENHRNKKETRTESAT